MTYRDPESGEIRYHLTLDDLWIFLGFGALLGLLLVFIILSLALLGPVAEVIIQQAY